MTDARPLAARVRVPWRIEGEDADLAAAITEFRSALPGWWFSVGACHVSCDASCGPDSAGQDAPLLASRLFDAGFHADLQLPATMAEALRTVTAEAASARRDAATSHAAVDALEGRDG